MENTENEASSEEIGIINEISVQQHSNSVEKLLIRFEWQRFSHIKYH